MKRKLAPDAERLARHLVAVVADIRTLVPELEDLHVIATERTRRGEQVRRQAPGPRPPSESAENAKRDRDTLASGDLRAAAVEKRIDAAAASLRTEIRTAIRLLHAGEGPDNTLRGSLLGAGDGTGARGELRRLQSAQRRREERGEYTAHRTWPQPSGLGG